MGAKKRHTIVQMLTQKKISGLISEVTTWLVLPKEEAFIYHIYFIVQ